jgi:hypothetical protein
VVGRLTDLFGPRRLFQAETALTGIAALVDMHDAWTAGLA